MKRRDESTHRLQLTRHDSSSSNDDVEGAGRAAAAKVVDTSQAYSGYITSLQWIRHKLTVDTSQAYSGYVTSLQWICHKLTVDTSQAYSGYVTSLQYRYDGEIKC